MIPFCTSNGELRCRQHLPWTGLINMKGELIRFCIFPRHGLINWLARMPAECLMPLSVPLLAPSSPPGCIYIYFIFHNFLSRTCTHTHTHARCTHTSGSPSW